MFEDCVKSTEDHYPFCEDEGPWTVVLESLAGIGVVVTALLLVAAVVALRRVQDCGCPSVRPTQLLFLLAVLGLFGLTFAFVLPLSPRTAVVRFLLFGVLFALCFSCLLAHAVSLLWLACGGRPLAWRAELGLALGLSLVQAVVAVEYVTLITTRGPTFACLTPGQLNADFVALLAYVLLLLVVTLAVAKVACCRPHERGRRPALLIFVAALVSLLIWVTWITMLTWGNPRLQRQPQWDDPTVGIGLLSNAWALLLIYGLPELCPLLRARRPPCPAPAHACPAPVYQRGLRMDHQDLSRARDSEGAEEDVALTPPGTPLPLQTAEPVQGPLLPGPC